MSRHSQKDMARYGTPIRTSVTAEVFQSLLTEAKRSKRSVGHIANEVLAGWHALQTGLRDRVSAALEDEAKRCGMTVAQLVATLVGYWYEDVYLPTLKAKGKNNGVRTEIDGGAGGVPQDTGRTAPEVQGGVGPDVRPEGQSS